MNILVATISTLTRTNASDYIIKVNGKIMGNISAVHTNESIVKALSKLNVKIDKLIALCSDRVLETHDERFDNLTALEYYTRRAKELFDDLKISHIAIDNRESSEILNDICTCIATNDTVYLDIAGGQRTIANIIQLLAKILQYKGIKNPLSLYSDIQNTDNLIVDTREFTIMTDIADAINEFVTTGKSIQLNNCLKNITEFSDLLSAMNEFSEKIMLCDIGNLDNTLSALKISIEKLSDNNSPSTIEQTIVKQLLPIICEKLFVGQASIDYKQIIRWCLANGLIQQAVTIYIEKMPVCYFQTGLLKEYVDLETVEPKQGHSKETAGFYEDLFDKFAGNSTDVLISDFKAFVKNVINNDTEMAAKKLIKNITEQQPQLQGKLINASNRLIHFIKEQYNQPKACITSRNGRQIPKPRTKAALYTLNAPKELSGFLNCLQITPEYHHYFVYCDKKKWETSGNSKLGTYEKKAFAIQKVKTLNKTLYAIMSHYLALKIMRNRMNHASETIFTDDEKIAVNYLQSIGFNIDFTISAITKIIESGLKIV